MKRKVIIVPFVATSERYKARFLVAKDRISGDWTFFSGTCEPYEAPQKCALRELHEETTGLLHLKYMPISTRHFRFQEDDRRVDVYFIPLLNYPFRSQQEELEKTFEEHQSMTEHFTKEFFENEKIKFLTLAQFQRKKPIWSFILRLMSRPKFIRIINKINTGNIRNRG